MGVRPRPDRGERDRQQGFRRGASEDARAARNRNDLHGAVQVRNLDARAEVVLKRYDGYWNASRRPKVAQVTFKIVKDESTLVESLNTGQIDGTIYGLDGRIAKGIHGPVNILKSPLELRRRAAFQHEAKALERRSGARGHSRWHSTFQGSSRPHMPERE